MERSTPAAEPAVADEAAEPAEPAVVAETAVPAMSAEPAEPSEHEDPSEPEDCGPSESKKARKKREAREKRSLEFKADRAERQRAKRQRMSALAAEGGGGSGEGREPFGGKTSHPTHPGGAAGDEVTQEMKRAERTARKAADVEDFKSRCNEGTTVLLDLEWESQMHRSEVKSLVQQLLYCYGANRKAEKPVRLVLSGVRQGSETRAGLTKQSGYDSWPITVSEGNYIDLYDRERLVYLTADSEEVVETFDPDKVYIIGGIVDRNRLKGVTELKATDQNIATAALPLSKYVDMGTYSRVLTVNHVLQIVLEFQRCGDWKEAIDRGIPGRKKFVDGETAAASDAQDAGVGACGESVDAPAAAEGSNIYLQPLP